MNVAMILWLRLLAKVGAVASVLGGLALALGPYDLWGRLMAAPPGAPGQRQIIFQLVVQPVLTALTPLMASGLLYVGCEIALYLNGTDRTEDRA